jgi:hypothetical protein
MNPDHIVEHPKEGLTSKHKSSDSDEEAGESSGVHNAKKRGLGLFSRDKVAALEDSVTRLEKENALLKGELLSFQQQQQQQQQLPLVPALSNDSGESGGRGGGVGTCLDSEVGGVSHHAQKSGGGTGGISSSRPQPPPPRDLEVSFWENLKSRTTWLVS